MQHRRKTKMTCHAACQCSIAYWRTKCFVEGGIVAKEDLATVTDSVTIPAKEYQELKGHFMKDQAHIGIKYPCPQSQRPIISGLAIGVVIGSVLVAVFMGFIL